VIEICKMPTKTFDLSWNLLVKSSIRDVEMQPKCQDIINNVVPVVEKLPDFQMKIARLLRSLINKASGKNPIPYLHMLFPVLFKGLRQDDFIENIFKNILEILVPVTNSIYITTLCKIKRNNCNNDKNSTTRKN